MSNTLLHHQIKGLALAQSPVFSLSMQIFLLSDSLSYPQRVSYYLTLFHTGLTYYFHDIGYPIIYPIVTFAYRKVKKYPIRSSTVHSTMCYLIPAQTGVSLLLSKVALVIRIGKI